MKIKFTILFMCLLFSKFTFADACMGTLPWKVPADPDGKGPEVSEVYVVLITEKPELKQKPLETVICYCEGKEKSYVSVVNRKNKVTRLHLGACTLVTDTTIKLSNASDIDAVGGFSKYHLPKKGS